MKLQLRRDLDANWVGKILLSGEPGFATDMGILKIGDGVTVWEELEGISGGSGGGGETLLADLAVGAGLTFTVDPDRVVEDDYVIVSVEPAAIPVHDPVNGYRIVLDFEFANDAGWKSLWAYGPYFNANYTPDETGSLNQSWDANGYSPWHVLFAGYHAWFAPSETITNVADAYGISDSVWNELPRQDPGFGDNVYDPWSTTSRPVTSWTIEMDVRILSGAITGTLRHGGSRKVRALDTDPWIVDPSIAGAFTITDKSDSDTLYKLAFLIGCAGDADCNASTLALTPTWTTATCKIYTY